MKFLKIFLCLFLFSGCFGIPSSFENECLNLAKGYQGIILNQEKDFKIRSWDHLGKVNKNIIQALTTNWVQTPQANKRFFDFFESLLRTRVWLECGTEELNQKALALSAGTGRQEIESQKKEINTPSFYHNCFTREWANSKNLILQSCLANFKK